MSTSPPSRSADQFVVRLPEGLRDLLKERAAANNRSMNAEIVARLTRTLDDDLEKVRILTEHSASMSKYTIDSILDIMLDRLKERESGVASEPKKVKTKKG